MEGATLVGSMLVGAGVFGVTLAVVLAVLGISNRANRVLSLLMLGHGLWTGLYGAGMLVDDPRTKVLLFSLYVYPVLAYGLLALQFALVFPRQLVPGRLGRWTWLPLLVVYLAMAVPYALEHSLYADISRTMTSPYGFFFEEGAHFGPLSSAGIPLGDTLTLVAAFLLIRTIRQLDPGPVRRLVAMGTFGVVMPALCACLVASLYTRINTDRAWWTGTVGDVLVDVAISVQLVGILVLGGLLVHYGLRERDATVRAFLIGFAVVISLTTALFFSVVYGVSSAAVPGVLLGVLAVAFFVGDLLVGYALVRRQVFDLDLRIKWTLRRGTVAGIFIAVFFVVTEGLANLLTERIGLIAGLLSTGALVFVLAPLQRAADRLADGAMPRVRPLAELSIEQRIDLFRQQAWFAYSDGEVSSDERRMLDFTRRRLSIDQVDAEAIERELAGP